MHVIHVSSVNLWPANQNYFVSIGGEHNINQLWINIFKEKLEFF